MTAPTPLSRLRDALADEQDVRWLALLGEPMTRRQRDQADTDLTETTLPMFERARARAGLVLADAAPPPGAREAADAP